MFKGFHYVKANVCFEVLVIPGVLVCPSHCENFDKKFWDFGQELVLLVTALSLLIGP